MSHPYKPLHGSKSSAQKCGRGADGLPPADVDWLHDLDRGPEKNPLDQGRLGVAFAVGSLPAGVPANELIIAGRHAIQGKAPLHIRSRVVGMLDDKEMAARPVMADAARQLDATGLIQCMGPHRTRIGESEAVKGRAARCSTS